MRRTKQMQGFIDSANAYFRANNVKETGDPVFCILSYYLLDNDLYAGYNFFKRKKINPGEVVNVLAGSGDPEKFDFLQLY